MTYENRFGLGYEKATEPGPDVEFKSEVGWEKRDKPDRPLGSFFDYRRPIKLQVGHRYVRRDGVVVEVQNIDKTRIDLDCRKYIGSDGLTRGINGNYWLKSEGEHPFDLVTHIEEPETKEEPMKDTVTVNNVKAISPLAVNFDVELTYAQIEAAHTEMVKQKAENKIKVGDIVKIKWQGKIFIAREKMAFYTKCDGGSTWNNRDLEKVTGTPEFMAQLRAVLEGK